MGLRLHLKYEVSTLNVSILDSLATFVLVTYLVIGVTYFVVGFLLLRASRMNYPEFYNNSKCKVLAATLILSLTMLTRFFLSLMRVVTNLNQDIARSIADDSYFAPLFQSILFVASDSIPVIAQLLTMVFGLIRAEQDKN